MPGARWPGLGGGARGGPVPVLGRALAGDRARGGALGAGGGAGACAGRLGPLTALERGVYMTYALGLT